MKKVLKGNEALAYAAKLARPGVVAAYPITPSTTFPEKISEFVANGELDAEFIPVESEHSAMSACIGAAATGVRTVTATASQGLALMHEVLFIASGMRLPIVLAIGNRALSAPINIWCDHQDTISQRDTGWLQFYAESNQEALDLMLIAFRVAEDKRVLLPAMVGIDAFVLTHTMEPVDVPEQEEVDDFLGEYRPEHAYLDPERPITQGSFGYPEHYMEFKYGQWLAMEKAKKVIDEVFEEFAHRFGRKYSKISTFGVEDADVVLITMGSMSGTAREAIRRMREDGLKVGMIKLTVYRPFPKEELMEAVKSAKVVCVLDRNVSFGFGGAVYGELAAVLSNLPERPRVYDFIIGLGGRDITRDDIRTVAEMGLKAAEGESIPEINWINVDKEAVEKSEGVIE